MAHVLHVLPHRGGGAETYIDLLERLDGLTHERVALSAGRTPAEAARSVPLGYARIARLARGADLVHAHGDVAGCLALPLLRGRPSVWSTHGLHFLRRASGLRGVVTRSALRAVIRATAQTICTSEAERRELSELVDDRNLDRLAVVHNGIDVPPDTDPAARAAARADLRLRDDEVAGLYLGQLEPRKEPLVAVEAATAAREGGAAFVLLVAGEGPLAHAVGKRAGPGVRVLGFRSDPERLLAAADVFVMPSRHEGLSFAVLEAMGRGLALVVSDGAGNPEAVGDAGLVVRRGDETGFRAAFERLARDPSERRRLGDAARARVGERFTVGAMLSGVAEAYDRALTAPGRGRGAARA